MEVTVLQFNTLADTVSNSFPLCHPEYLSWSYRKKLILEKLLSNNIDVICLQEVDHYDELKDEMSKHGYHGIFKKKNGENKDGSVIFFSSRLSINRVQSFEYDSDMSQVGIIAEFSFSDHDPHTHTFIVATTHFKAKPEFEETRKRMANILLDKINEINIDFLPVIIALDMNAEPTSESYAILSSSYKSVFEPKFTTFKIRQHKVCRTIDYILYCRNVDVISKNNLPTEEEIGENGLPNQYHPSDHLDLMATFRIF